MQKPLPDRVCLCIHGSAACSAEWLAAVRAQLPDKVRVIVAGTGARILDDAEAFPIDTDGTPSPEEIIAALAAKGDGDVAVLVRSDADLPPYAITRLLHALEVPGVRAAGALDNLDPLRSPLPTGATSDETSARIDALCHAYGERRLVDSVQLSPLASAWRLDADAAGGRTVTLDHLYVAVRDAPLGGASADVDPRDPQPPSPFAGLRTRVAEALATPACPAYAGLDGKPVLLHVLHGWGGGAERWVRDFCGAYAHAHHRVLVARGSHARRRHGEWLELHDGTMVGPPLQRIALPVAIADTDISNPAYRALFETILREHGIAAVIVSSLIGHSLDVLRSGLPTLRIVHDHYPLWPVLHRDFGDRSLAFDDEQRRADLAAAGTDGVFAPRDAERWKMLREASVAAWIAAGATLVAPSRAALDNERRLAPELHALRASVIPHGVADWPLDAPRAATPPTRALLRLVVPGRVRHGKGAELLTALLPRLRGVAEVFLIGAGADAQAFFGQSGVHVVLDYRHADLPRLLATIAADAALLLPTVSETFGYTLSELRSLGLPVVATRVGALVERIDDGVDGFLVAVDAAAIAARLVALDADRGALTRVRANLDTRREPDLVTMTNAYAELLPASPRVTAAPARLLDADSQHEADQTSRLQAATRERQSLAAALAATVRESARRGDWGHALDRELAAARARIDALHADFDALHVELDARTRWALDLDGQVKALTPFKPAYEMVVGSRSWRLTAPLRDAATRWRELSARLAFRKAHLVGSMHRLRGSLVRNGLAGTLARLRRELGGASVPIARRQYAAPADTFVPFAVPTSATPRVSIIIPVHNKFAYTAACLRSLAEHADAIAFEVIVVDDASSDDTLARLAEIEGVLVERNAENLGFVGSCNAGAARARGEFVLFLNNDTVVTTGWLAALLRCFEKEPDAGLVGAQLVYPDGRLQEAGGIVFSDASGWNFGRFADPDDPRYAFRRDADYCSGAAILLRRDLFERLGRFDRRYAPAYYEDTDLAFAVRAAGLRVIYEPRSRVIHFEGITAGTDTGSGMKRFQVVNQAKFLDKWRDALVRQPAAGTPIGLAATHRAQRRILVIDATTPTPDQDSGSLRMVNLFRVLRRNACHVVFMASNRAWVERYTADLQALGIEVLYHPLSPDPVTLFRERGREFDAILLSRHYVAVEYVGLARLYAPQARLVFDTVDLHYLREQRAAELEQRSDLARQAEATRRQELKLMRECDVTLVVSPVEQAILAVDAPGVAVDVLSNVHEVHGCRRPFGARRDLVFVGSFQHPPNVDAMLWYAREVQPRVVAALPDVILHVIGSQVTDEVRALAGANLVVHGFIDDIAPYMDGCRISLAPLRYGAGVKGKVNMAMSYGLPVVATPMAVEGMHVRAGEEVLVAVDADAFAAAVVSLYAEESAWNRLSRNGLANVAEHFSFAAAETAIRRIVGF